MIFLLFMTFFFILLLEAPKLLVQKQFKELIVFLFLWSAALLVALLQTLHVNIPSPVAPITEFLKKIVPQ